MIKSRTFRGDSIGRIGGEAFRAIDHLHVRDCRFFDLGNGASLFQAEQR